MKLNTITSVLGRALILAAAGAVLAGCAGLPAAPQSASQLGTGASRTYTHAAALRFTGTMSVPEGALEFSVTEGGRGRAQDGGALAEGSGTVAGVPFRYLATPGGTYLQGQSYWQAYYQGQADQQTQARGYEEKWVRVEAPNDVVSSLSALLDLGGVESDLFLHADSLKKGGTREDDGRRATALTYAGHIFWVVPGNPDRLVGFTAPVAGAMRSVNVKIAPAAALHVEDPAESQVVDPDDGSTLPARFEARDARGEGCSPDSCRVTADIVNLGGEAEGQSTVRIWVVDASGATAAACTTVIAPFPGTSGTASCLLSGAEWRAWAGTNPGLVRLPSVPAQAEITSNPPYTG